MKTIVACIVAALCVSTAFGQTTQPTSQPAAWVPTTQPDFSTPEQFLATIPPEILAEQRPMEHLKWSQSLKGKTFRCEGLFYQNIGTLVALWWNAAGARIYVEMERDRAFADKLAAAKRGCPVTVDGVYFAGAFGLRRDPGTGEISVGIRLQPSRIVSVGAEETPDAQAAVPTSQPDFTTPEQFMATITPELLASRNQPGGFRQFDKWVASLKGKSFRCEGHFTGRGYGQPPEREQVAMSWKGQGIIVHVHLGLNKVFPDGFPEEYRGVKPGTVAIIVEGIFAYAFDTPKRDSKTGNVSLSLILHPARIVSMGPK